MMRLKGILVGARNDERFSNLLESSYLESAG